MASAPGGAGGAGFSSTIEDGPAVMAVGNRGQLRQPNTRHGEQGRDVIRPVENGMRQAGALGLPIVACRLAHIRRRATCVRPGLPGHFVSRHQIGAGERSQSR
jgi:hypothetical protein